MRLWEVKHPYYMNPGNYFQAGQHTEWKSWPDFYSEYNDVDIDYNWLVRWDWLEGEYYGAGEYNGDDYYRNGIFRLQIIGQRKAYLGSHDVSVCRADEPAIRDWLEKYWQYMKAMWKPLSETI